MNKKHDHNAKLIMTVKDVQVAQTKSLPPRTFVIAQGEARTNATNPRLVLRKHPTIPETLQLDFEADEGPREVITPVTAVYEIDGSHEFNQVTVHAETDSISREVPPATSLAGKTGEAVTAFEIDFNSTTAFMVLNTSPDDTIKFVNYDLNAMTVTAVEGNNNESAFLFKINGTSVRSFDIDGGGKDKQVTVPPHDSTTIYAISFSQKVATGAILNTVKGYIKVKGAKV